MYIGNILCLRNGSEWTYFSDGEYDQRVPTKNPNNEFVIMQSFYWEFLEVK